MWLTKLKIAIVEKNVDAFSRLMDEIPQMDNIKEMQEAVYLIKEASELLYGLQDEASNSMKQIKKNLEFLKSTTSQTSNRLDTRS